MSRNDSPSEMITETKSAGEDYSIVRTAIEFVMPNQIRIKSECILQDMNGVTVTVTPWELNNCNLQLLRPHSDV